MKNVVGYAFLCMIILITFCSFRHFNNKQKSINLFIIINRIAILINFPDKLNCTFDRIRVNAEKNIGFFYGIFEY